MRSRSHIGAAVVSVSLLLTFVGHAQEPAGTTPTNDAILQHMQELEREVKELQTEVATLKSVPAPTPTPSSTTVTPPAAPQNNLVTGTPGAPAASPSLAGLLGPTSVSGFVDVYYGQNFNNPASQANGLRFFDGGSQSVWPEHGGTHRRQSS